MKSCQPIGGSSKSRIGFLGLVNVAVVSPRYATATPSCTRYPVTTSRLSCGDWSRNKLDRSAAVTDPERRAATTRSPTTIIRNNIAPPDKPGSCCVAKTSEIVDILQYLLPLIFKPYSRGS